MPKDGGAPKAPSYKGLFKAIKKTRRKDKKMAHKQMEWANRFYRDAKELNKDVVADLREVMEFQLTNAQTDRALYEDVFMPLIKEQLDEVNQFQQRALDFDEEVKLLKDEALRFKSEANQKYMAGKAMAGVSQAFAAKKAETERQLLDMGVNPNSGASQSLTAGINLAEGAAQAAAGTTAADAARVEGDVKYQAALDRQIQAGALAEAGLNLQGGMVQIGQSIPGQVAVEAGQVGEAGAQAVDSTIGIADAATRARSLAAEYHRLNQANLDTWSTAITNKFQNKLGLYQAQLQKRQLDLQEQQLEQQSSSGIGGLIGAGAGVLRSFLPGFNEGGFVEEGYAGGGAVDDTDVVPARLTPGEFVVPDHVVRWKGEQYFQKLIDSAPKQKEALIAETGARAQPVPATQGALTI